MVQTILGRIGVVLPALAVAAVAAPVCAQEINYTSQSATTSAMIAAVGGDLMSSAVTVVGSVMGIAVFLFLVFWAWRKYRGTAMR